MRQTRCGFVNARKLILWVGFGARNAHFAARKHDHGRPVPGSSRLRSPQGGLQVVQAAALQVSKQNFDDFAL